MQSKLLILQNILKTVYVTNSSKTILDLRVIDLHKTSNRAPLIEQALAVCGTPCFTLKALFVFQIFTFLFRYYGPAGKRLDKKVSANFNIYDITNWIAENYNAYIWSVNRV